jgi:bacterioferritin
MEIETVMGYIANSVNLEGIRAQEIRESLERDIDEELAHARRLAARIKELYGVVPRLAGVRGGADVPAAAGRADPRRAGDQGVIEAESGAIAHYNRIIAAADGVDWVTQDFVIGILHDEAGHPAPVRGLPARVRAGRGVSLHREPGCTLDRGESRHAI